MQTLNWARVGSTVLIVHARVLPDVREWAALNEDCMGMRGLIDRTLVFADVALSAEQRRQVAELHRYLDMGSVAVITSLRLTRMLVTVMNWTRNNLRAFSPRDIVAAFDYLGVSEPE